MPPPATWSIVPRRQVVELRHVGGCGHEDDHHLRGRGAASGARPARTRRRRSPRPEGFALKLRGRQRLRNIARLMRSHYCGQVNEKLLGQEVTVAGWVHRRRDHGGVIFVDLRDREGLLQVVFDPELAPAVRGGRAAAQRVRGAGDRAWCASARPAP